MQTFRVVMKGLKQGVAPRDAEALLAETFQIGVDQARILLAQLPVKVKSAVPYDRAQEYLRSIEQAGGDGVIEAEPAPDPGETLPELRTMSGHSVIENGITISQIDYEPPEAATGGGLRLLRSWFAARAR